MRTQALKSFAMVAVALLLASGCSSRQIYQSGIGWRQNECQKLLDAAERARCLETANKDYDSYDKERTTPAEQR